MYEKTKPSVKTEGYRLPPIKIVGLPYIKKETEKAP